MFKLNFDVKKHYLDNGLEVITIKKDTQIASINVGIKVGAMNENINQKGISHFIEHMLFKGTAKRNNEELNYELESLGGEYNAYTDYDATVYTISCLSEELINAVNILGDMVTSSIFSEDELEKERGVILAEIRSSKDDIEDFSFNKVNEVGFNKSPLKYEVTGILDKVKNFTKDEIVAYYKKYYCASNAVITIVSSLEHKEALKIVEESFGNWNKGKKSELVTINEKNIEKTVTTYKSNIEQSTVTYLYTYYDLKKDEELPLKFLNHRLGESANSLLFREIREKRGLAYDIYTHLDMTSNIKTLYIYTAVSKEDVNETIEAINETINKIKNDEINFGDKDLNIMKKVHKTAVISTIEDSAELCNYILHQELDGEDIFEFISDMNELNSLNKERISNVARKVLNNPTIHILSSNND